MPVTTPHEIELVAPAATIRLLVGVGIADFEACAVWDARGDGFTERVGVGEAGAAGLAVAVARGVGVRECVGVALGAGEEEATVIAPVMNGCTSQ